LSNTNIPYILTAYERTAKVEMRLIERTTRKGSKSPHMKERITVLGLVMGLDRKKKFVEVQNN